MAEYNIQLKTFDNPMMIRSGVTSKTHTGVNSNIEGVESFMRGSRRYEVEGEVENKFNFNKNMKMLSLEKGFLESDGN